MNHRIDRAIFFVDGSNFYHGCERLPLSNLGRLNFAKLCAKLAGPRQWTATRYYVGEVLPLATSRWLPIRSGSSSS